MIDEAIYVYAIAPVKSPALPAELVGVSGEKVEAIRHENLVAYASRVPLDEFGESPLRRNLEDLDWLERTARAHDAVVAKAFETSVIVPVRLATIFNDVSNLRNMLEQERDKILALLERLRGQREWGVKGFIGEAQNDSRSQIRTGTEYLQRRRNALNAQQAATEIARVQAERVHAVLHGIATASRLRPCQDSGLSSSSRPMILNATYLVADDRIGSFKETVGEMTSPGLVLELTGPWAPYSFAAFDMQATARAAQVRS
jgi:hypothetical protein